MYIQYFYELNFKNQWIWLQALATFDKVFIYRDLNNENLFTNLQINSFYFKEQSPRRQFQMKTFLAFIKVPKMGNSELDLVKEKPFILESLFIFSF